jgi:hypothetical protein
VIKLDYGDFKQKMQRSGGYNEFYEQQSGALAPEGKREIAIGGQNRSRFDWRAWMPSQYVAEKCKFRVAYGGHSENMQFSGVLRQ